MKPMKKWRYATYFWNNVNMEYSTNQLGIWSRNETHRLHKHSSNNNSTDSHSKPSSELPDPSFWLSYINNNFAGAEYVLRGGTHRYTCTQFTHILTFSCIAQNKLWKIILPATWDLKLNKLYVFNFHFKYYMNSVKTNQTVTVLSNVTSFSFHFFFSLNISHLIPLLLACIYIYRVFLRKKGALHRTVRFPTKTIECMKRILFDQC